MSTVSGLRHWRKRLSRALGFDRNPLRRASDRMEAWLRAGLLIVFLTAGPIAALAAGRWTAAAAGTGTGAPHQGGATGAAVLTAVMTLAVMALALLTVHRLVKRFLDWRRIAAWEADWRATGPRWTGRR